MKRTDERNEFLTDILTGAIENYGYGWFEVDEYKWESVPLGDAYAVITQNEEEDEPQHRVDLDVIARGLGVIRDAQMRVDDEYPNDGEVLHNRTSGKRLYMAPGRRRNIMLADRTNGDDGDLDVVDYLNIVECGLFGAVLYN